MKAAAMHLIRRIAPLAATLAALAASPASRALDLDTALRNADHYRMSADNLQVDTLVQTYTASGELDKARRYTVFAQSGRQSLVLMQSPAEKGQKVLMLGDDFWLLMPNSQRPMRITPMQKLLGDASTGDIATLSWSGDYRATLVGEEGCQPDDTSARGCLHLSLQSTRKGVTYQRIELWLGKTRHEPVRADLYVQSDKLAKQALFTLDKTRTLVTDMTLIDQLGKQKRTTVSYLSRKPRSVPAEWLNPMFLARTPTLE